jgi:hypothetical protein
MILAYRGDRRVASADRVCLAFITRGAASKLGSVRLHRVETLHTDRRGRPGGGDLVPATYARCRLGSPGSLRLAHFTPKISLRLTFGTFWAAARTCCTGPARDTAARCSAFSRFASLSRASILEASNATSRSGRRPIYVAANAQHLRGRCLRHIARCRFLCRTWLWDLRSLAPSAAGVIMGLCYVAGATDVWRASFRLPAVSTSKRRTQKGRSSYRARNDLWRAFCRVAYKGIGHQSLEELGDGSCQP